MLMDTNEIQLDASSATNDGKVVLFSLKWLTLTKNVCQIVASGRILLGYYTFSHYTSL